MHISCIRLNQKNALARSVHFVGKKQFQSEINVGQLVNHNNAMKDDI